MNLLADHALFLQIASEVGTPAYVYSTEHIRAQYKALSDSFAKNLPADRQPLICYACKANSHLAILSLLKNMGSGIECVSEGELRRALKAGFTPAKIVSEGVGKSESEIRLGLEAGIHQFNVESLSELQKINAIAQTLNKQAHVIFRLNPDIGGGGNDKITTGRSHDKFGMNLPFVMQAYKQAQTLPHIKAVGLHTHIGSQISSAASFETLFHKFTEIVPAIRQEGFEVSRLDIGGGFPISYKNETLLDLDTYTNLVNRYIVPLETEIIIEPGRYIVGNAGIILTKILYIKETESRKFIILDAGMNNLVRPAMYDSWHDIQPLTNHARPVETYDIAGPICESADMFGRERAMPAVAEGDILVIKSAGAYGTCMASNYNSRPHAAEVMVDENNYEIITPRQTYDEMLGRETIPQSLK